MTTWIRVSDDCLEHPKFLGLSPSAVVLWLAGLQYSSRHLTDGLIPRRYVVGTEVVQRWRAPANELVTAGLWHEMPDGWVIHDYLDYQRSSTQIRDQRRKGAERQRRHRTSGKGDL